jgi:hypothetical protein
VRCRTELASEQSIAYCSRKLPILDCSIYNCCGPHFGSRSPKDFTNPRAAFARAVRALTSSARARITVRWMRLCTAMPYRLGIDSRQSCQRPRIVSIVSFCSFKISSLNACIVLIFFPAGLLSIALKARHSLGAYRIPLETGLLPAVLLGPSARETF